MMYFKIAHNDIPLGMALSVEKRYPTSSHPLGMRLPQEGWTKSFAFPSGKALLVEPSLRDAVIYLRSFLPKEASLWDARHLSKINTLMEQSLTMFTLDQDRPYQNR
jgi:hypothetical protein